MFAASASSRSRPSRPSSARGADAVSEPTVTGTPAPARLVVLAGPTAVGKGTVTATIRDDHPGVWIPVSAQTLPARPGEVDGVHYDLVSDLEHDAMIATHTLPEWPEQ